MPHNLPKRAQQGTIVVALKKVGNRIAVVIPTSILKDLGIRAGQH